jgi:hypothetical protein
MRGKGLEDGGKRNLALAADPARSKVGIGDGGIFG